MQVWVTVDKLDGSTRQIGPLYTDEINLGGMLFKLMEADVAGVTFTRANPLQKLMAEQKK